MMLFELSPGLPKEVFLIKDGLALANKPAGIASNSSNANLMILFIL
jgi:hypothetical protein